MGKRYLATTAAVQHDFDLKSQAGRQDVVTQMAAEQAELREELDYEQSLVDEEWERQELMRLLFGG